ncbi:hypothetical protein QBC32DRAFT_404711 [Pseudoneurospora amorphoporcata]|uniref:G-patch domain-containing protein n=1 Tax=Pseudoneurospora amorphoporcata TaxID=241081 RepID=A0AAN6P181_9PEZI|nr:hypothetical protein QBC32DRAFT_404711 [Pseudoneurospora amorphoporcata]
MSYKRSRATFEADLTAQQSPYVFFGTPLPPRDPEVRDDGSYVPIWKQEVRDERGRKRLHGAFTGGFSAGYFNTVGSKEGWTPSTFVSSRTNRHKDAAKPTQQRPEDFMDEEDLADAAEAKKIQTNAAFAGLGSTANDAIRASGLMGLFRTQGETMGVKLLKKMGWREGQGIGPKVRRKARLELQTDTAAQGDTFLFAPDNVPMIAFVKKTDKKGLGYTGESRLTPVGLSGSKKSSHGDTDDEDDYGALGRPKLSIGGTRKKETSKIRGSIGIGVLNDTGSDDEDPYEVGPKISYNRVIGGDKKKKKATIAANPTLQAKPKFITKKAASSILGKVGLGVRKCHDGRLPLDGFVFGKEPDTLTTEINSEGKYPPPQIPPGWVSSKTPKPESGGSPGNANYVSTTDVAKASTLDPKARAALLGEKQLPGKSVFDFISPASRDRLAAVTGRADLPQALGEVPAAYARSEAEKQQELLDRVPKLDKETAIAAISRGVGGGAPYSEDEEKRARYRAYLEFQAGFRPQGLPPKPKKLTDEEWLREFHEFFNCARIFKPMTGFMASRFTTSSSTKLATATTGDATSKEVLSRPPPKAEDPAEEAARLGMFGTMTRSTTDFYPTRLLCKRFGVKPPAHVMPDNHDATASSEKKKDDLWSQFQSYGHQGGGGPGSVERELLGLEFGSTGGGGGAGGGSTAMADLERGGEAAQKPAAAPVLDTSRNEALEGKRPGDEVFKAIFGDSDDDEL